MVFLQSWLICLFVGPRPSRRLRVFFCFFFPFLRYLLVWWVWKGADRGRCITELSVLILGLFTQPWLKRLSLHATVASFWVLVQLQLRFLRPQLNFFVLDCPPPQLRFLFGFHWRGFLVTWPCQAAAGRPEPVLFSSQSAGADWKSMQHMSSEALYADAALFPIY